MTTIQISELTVPYDRFLNDIAANVVAMLKSDNDDPEFISQRKAYEMFGRRNVQRWRLENKVIPCKRPGKIEYRTSDLRLLQRMKYDNL